MDIKHRNHVVLGGTGSRSMVFVHGFGCDQSMWRLLAPAYADRFQIILLDLVGSGASDLTAYDTERYDSLQGYADDIIEVIGAHATGPVVFVGHSVSAMIGVLANLSRPDLFAAQVMIGPSPCYIDDGDYKGGFSRHDIDALLDTLDGNYLGWASTIAPVIMGAPHQPELGEELTRSFCRTDPTIASHFARVTFLSDNRADLPRLTTPTLILQCSDDFIAPREVGAYMHRVLPNSRLEVLENVGHCPHLSAPDATKDAIDAFLATLEP